MYNRRFLIRFTNLALFSLVITSSEQSTTKDPVQKEKKPVVESKWVEIKESDENASQKKKEPFFL